MVVCTPRVDEFTFGLVICTPGTGLCTAFNAVLLTFFSAPSSDKTLFCTPFKVVDPDTVFSRWRSASLMCCYP